MNVFFAGGGTGGHLYPALAIARAMVAADPRVRPFFIGAKRGIEREILPTAEFPFELLDLHPLYRSQPWRNWRTATGSVTSWRKIAQIAAASPPCALVATGGYAAGVALGFAAARRIPIVIQEQNSFPGLTVRWFASRATQIHLGFPEAARQLHLSPRTQLFTSGNPIAAPIPMEQRPAPAGAEDKWGFKDPARPTVLVFGGSQGAEAINRVVAEWVLNGIGDANLIWATGRANYDKYARLDGPSVRIAPFLSPMADAYCAADVAVTRAGAMTTAELSAWGIPAILVPLPTAAADHQTANATALSASGAAVMIRQSAFTARSLSETITLLLRTPGMLQGLREKTLMRARPNAAQDIANHILSMSCFK